MHYFLQRALWNEPQRSLKTNLKRCTAGCLKQPSVVDWLEFSEQLVELRSYSVSNSRSGGDWKHDSGVARDTAADVMGLVSLFFGVNQPFAANQQEIYILDTSFSLQSTTHPCCWLQQCIYHIIMYMHWLRLPAKLASRVRVRVSMPACLSSVASSRHLTYPWRLNAAVSIVRFCAILRAGRRGRVTHSASTRRQQLSARRGPQDLKQPQKQHLVNQIKHIYST